MATKAETGGAAFPRPASVDPRHGTLPDGDRVIEEEDGMTLRDYFAAKAIAGIVATHWDSSEESNIDVFAPDLWAKTAYALADAMLAARSK